MKYILTVFFVLFSSISLSEVVTVIFNGELILTPEEEIKLGISNGEVLEMKFSYHVDKENSYDKYADIGAAYNCDNIPLMSTTKPLISIGDFVDFKGGLIDIIVRSGPFESYYLKIDIGLFDEFGKRDKVGETNTGYKVSRIYMGIGFPIKDGRRCKQSKYVNLDGGHNNYPNFISLFNKRENKSYHIPIKATYTYSVQK